MSNWKKLSEHLNFEDAEAFLALTFEFRDEMLYKLAGGDNKKAPHTLHHVKPVVFYDARKTKECRSSPLSLEQHPLHIEQGLHHSKAYCSIFKDKAVLSLGSANLTFQGLTLNRETIVTYTEPELIKEFYDFLILNYKAGPGYNDYPRFLNKLKPFTETKILDENKKLITNGYDKSGLEQLVEFWRKFETKPAKKLFLISAFFDSNRFILERFQDEKIVDEDSEIGIGASYESSLSFPLCKKHGKYLFETFKKVKTYNCVKEVTAKAKDEWGQIQKNDGFKADARYERPLHSKVLVLEGEFGTYLYVGSANFTSNAWSGKNKELGVISRITDLKANELIDQLQQYHLAEEKKVEVDKLREQLPKDEDEEELSQDLYPYFINSILAVIKNDLPMFTLDCGEVDKLKDYSFEWGSPLELKELTLIAHNGETLINLMKCRHIKVTHHTGVSYYIPFKLSSSIFENLEKIHFNNSDEWIESYALKSFYTWDYPANGILDDDDDFDVKTGTKEDLDVNREGNLTIQMQRFLTFISFFEKDLKERVVLFKKEKIATKIINQDDPNNLLSLVKWLETELKLSKFPDVQIFKLGELFQVFKRLSKEDESRDEFSLLNIGIKNTIEQYLKDHKLTNTTPYKQYLRLING